MGANGNPKPFTTDENAFRLAWSRLTEEQKQEMLYRWSQHWGGHIDRFMMAVLDSTLPQRCEWLLAVLEGKP